MTLLNKISYLAALAVIVSLEPLPQAHAETCRCSFEEGGIERTEILSRVADSFNVTRDWMDGDFKVEVPARNFEQRSNQSVPHLRYHLLHTRPTVLLNTPLALTTCLLTYSLSFVDALAWMPCSLTRPWIAQSFGKMLPQGSNITLTLP